jgi:putative flavoprotein involved in K+ transport
MNRTETLVIGAGQAGLALSWHLTRAGRDHVLLERGRVGERWRSERWDSLTLLTPNWLNQLPGSQRHPDQDGYLSGPGFIRHLDGYAASFGAPVRQEVAVRSVEALPSGGFRATTDDGVWAARNVVSATGDCDLPAIPPAAGAAPGWLRQLHTSEYRSADLLPPGGVLVVGAGASGQQIAREVRRAGREVVIAAGRHARIPRRYRGQDIWHWLVATGDLDVFVEDLPDPAASKSTPSLPLSGANGGEHLDLQALHRAGVAVAGRLERFDGARAVFATDLAAHVLQAERRMRRVLEKIDEHIAAAPDGWSAPPAEPIAGPALPPEPASIDLAAAGIRTVIWATGYRRAYPWLPAEAVGADGELVHTHGVTPIPGLYALGLRFQRKRKSHFIGGVGEDAEHLARRIVASAACPGGECGRVRAPRRTAWRGGATVRPAAHAVPTSRPV